MKLWFENSHGVERIINEQANTWQDVNHFIDLFIENCNTKKKTHPFVRYYTRIWEQADGRVRIDVGSHTEFFIWEGSLNDYRANTNTINANGDMV